MNTIKRLITDERGLETVEYAIITGLIVIGVIGFISTIGDYVHDQFQSLAETKLTEGVTP